MGVCREYRISHSHFLGGPPRWTQDDRDKAIWDQLRRAQLCQNCGTHPEDWDPASGGDRNAYSAVVRRCAGCAVLEQKRAQHDADSDKGRGESVQLKKREEVAGGLDSGAHGRHQRVETATTPAAGSLGRPGAA